MGSSLMELKKLEILNKFRQISLQTYYIMNWKKENQYNLIILAIAASIWIISILLVIIGAYAIKTIQKKYRRARECI